MAAAPELDLLLCPRQRVPTLTNYEWVGGRIIWEESLQTALLPFTLLSMVSKNTPFHEPD